MKTKIKINAPVLEIFTKGPRKGGKFVSIELNTKVEGELKVGTVEIDFTNLLPFAYHDKSDVLDFFLFTAIIYGTDRFIERRKNSVDGWSRDLEIELPVRNISFWNSSKNKIQKMLSFLTGDYWSLSFYEAEYNFPKEPLKEEFKGSFAHVNLFSGGLDSLIGALDHLKTKPNEKIILVSHFDRKMAKPHKDQLDLLKLIKPIYGDQYVQVPSINVSLINSDIKTETTLRSRSLLFSGMAMLIAQSKQIPSIIVPENGSVSLNFPLSSSRRSACSTRTTHPTVLSLLGEIWVNFGFKITLYNPYEFKTKGEMVKECSDQINLSKLSDISNSCGKRGHRAHWDSGLKSASHCGVCMPCVYRRAALLSTNDKTTYGNDLNKLNLLSKKGQDIGALLNFLNRNLTPQDIKNELIVNGVKEIIKLNEYTDLVFRTRVELKNYINKFGNKEFKRKAGL